MKERNKAVPAVYLIVYDCEKILLGLRQNTGYKDGCWNLPSGHIETGELPTEAMVREAKEEAGIDIQPQDLMLVHVMHRKKPEENDERIDFFFKCSKWGGEIKNMEPHKCDDLSWFPIGQLPENTIPYIKAALGFIDSRQIYSEFSE